MSTMSSHSAYFQSLLLFCITVILVVLLPFVSTTASITKKETDEVALKAFKSKIGPRGVLNSWNDSHHFCEWEGITCGRRHRRVTALDLNSRGLYGSLSPYIGNLSFLRDLTLQNNGIQGEIPHEFGNLFSFGSVYKGILDQDGAIVAVKVLNLQHQGASKSFKAECKALRNIRHRNLVKVITSCSSIDFQGNDFKAIVYEFMENGSLEKWLHPVRTMEEEELDIQNLTLIQRLSIAIDVASAVDYLHHQCQEPILHCDLKPSNVLLDSDMTAHVGDFGLVKFLPKVSNQIESSSMGVRGTIGYTPPEYGLGSEVSTHGDVYSYGILLLEMVTRKKPTDFMFEGDLTLHNFARTALPDRVMEIVDPILINEEVAASNHMMSHARNNNNKEQCLISMVRIGVACSMESPQDRMSITHAISELQSVRNILLQPATTRFNQQNG